MASVRQLGKEDMLFVAGETAEVYQHTAGLVILDTSNCPDFSFKHLKEKVIERIREISENPGMQYPATVRTTNL